MNKAKLISILISLNIIFQTNCFKIDRVILSTDNNPNYIQFWPIVAKVWRDIMGIKPTLALIADKSVVVDETLGDVIRFEPIPGVSNALYAQAVRLLLPVYFEEDICITSDIDMIPCSKAYFTKPVSDLPEDVFVVYKDGAAYFDGYTLQYPMCYNASKGKVFKEIFNIKHVNEIPKVIQQWAALGLGWNTDEKTLYKHLSNWQNYNSKCIKLGHSAERRIDRLNWGYDKALLKEGHYTDAHVNRPYNNYKKEIDELVDDLYKSKITKSEKSQEKPFVIVIASYNNKSWVQKNLDSVFSQKYSNYRVIYTDDNSSDKNGELVENYIKSNKLGHKITLIRNTQRKEALENIYNAIHTCKPEEIIVSLDGDDWFAHEDVLNRLNKEYQDPNTWVTYGQFSYYPINQIGFAAQVPQNVIDQNSFREQPWTTTHLRTFYAGLFQRIKKEDFLNENKFFIMSWDLAFMFPIMEMAGNHSRFIPDILYIYNITGQMNGSQLTSDEKANKGGREYQLSIDSIIKQRTKYNKLESLSEKQINKNKKIYITSGHWGELFNTGPVFNSDDQRQPTYQLREAFAQAGYKLIQEDNLDNLKDFDYIIAFDVPEYQIHNLKKYPKEKLILFLWEPPSTAPYNYDKNNHIYFSKIYTWLDDLVDNKKYFKFYYPNMNPIIEPITNFEDKKLCTLIACNKSSVHIDELYSARMEIIKFLERLNNNDFDFYGRSWDSSQYKNYKGSIHKKVAILKNYKFSICYENIKNIKGYITEKILDCFRAGCIPVYWGASNITDYIPENCFINRENFISNSELYKFMKNMPRDEYEKYIENIKNFLKSKKAELFSIKNFIEIFKQACNIT